MTDATMVLAAGIWGIAVGCALIPLLPWHAAYSAREYVNFWRRVVGLPER